MESFLNFLFSIKEYSIPQILIITGVIFIAFSLGIHLFQVDREINKRYSAIFGILFFTIGIVSFYLPVLCSYNWYYERECEFPSRSSVGQLIDRGRASNNKVHGQFGCDGKTYKAKSGVVEYGDIRIPKTENLFLTLTYSKNSELSGIISIFIDKEKRGEIIPKNHGDWNKFYTESSNDLGPVKEGLHSLTFKTKGQDYCVADLDMFKLYKKDK